MFCSSFIVVYNNLIACFQNSVNELIINETSQNKFGIVFVSEKNINRSNHLLIDRVCICSHTLEKVICDKVISSRCFHSNCHWIFSLTWSISLQRMLSMVFSLHYDTRKFCLLALLCTSIGILFITYNQPIIFKTNFLIDWILSTNGSLSQCV